MKLKLKNIWLWSKILSVVANITPSTGDEQLMQMLCGGNRKAFELLYDRYFDKLVWFAFGFVNDRQKAEDVVQEVFLKVIVCKLLF